jgi:hypothetical protein
MAVPVWVRKLQLRWGVTPRQVIIILIVFAMTGTTVLLIKQPILHAIFQGEDPSWIFYLLYYILILPIYNLFLLIYGFILGQFTFFWEFEKRFFSRIIGRK